MCNDQTSSVRKGLFRLEPILITSQFFKVKLFFDFRPLYDDITSLSCKLSKHPKRRLLDLEFHPPDVNWNTADVM